LESKLEPSVRNARLKGTGVDRASLLRKPLVQAKAFGQERATVAMAITEQGTDLETLTTVIAHSQIVVARAFAGAARRLPAGFEAADVAILDWIASEGRRAGRGLVRM